MLGRDVKNSIRTKIEKSMWGAPLLGLWLSPCMWNIYLQSKKIQIAERLFRTFEGRWIFVSCVRLYGVANELIPKKAILDLFTPSLHVAMALLNHKIGGIFLGESLLHGPNLPVGERWAIFAGSVAIDCAFWAHGLFSDSRFLAWRNLTGRWFRWSRRMFAQRKKRWFFRLDKLSFDSRNKNCDLDRGAYVVTELDSSDPFWWVSAYMIWSWFLGRIIEIRVFSAVLPVAFFLRSFGTRTRPKLII